MGNFNVQAKRIWKPVTFWDQFRFMFSSYCALWRYAIIMHKVEDNKFLVLRSPGEVVLWKGTEYNATIFFDFKRANSAYKRLFLDAPNVEIVWLRPVEIKE